MIPMGGASTRPGAFACKDAPVSLCAMLPRDVDKPAVCGKAMPMEQDALNYARMAPDVMVTGYLAGRVAGAAERCETAG